MTGIRLQGGPFDGRHISRKGFRFVYGGWHELPLEQLPAVLYVVFDEACGEISWNAGRPLGDEAVYHRDREDKRGWLIYLYTDEDRDRHISLARSVLALDGAGA